MFPSSPKFGGRFSNEITCPACDQTIPNAVDDPHRIDCELREYDALETQRLRRIYTGADTPAVLESSDEESSNEVPEHDPETES